MDTRQNILLVEDDLNLGFLLMELLETEHFVVKWCREAKSGILQFKKMNFDLCILDIMMPGMDGFCLAKKLKELNPKIPFLFLTARLLKEDKLKGYELGAEDFLTKPFDEDELICKIKVILRRSAFPLSSCQPTQFELGNYQFFYDRQELAYEDEVCRITEKENEVLYLLCLHRNQILRRDLAVEQIYGKKDYFLGRSFDVFISRLRKLLNKDSRISIDNVFKVGFILNIKEHSGPFTPGS
ncbi:MAG: transcriptional regulator [Saprospiraceae bacterium]|nr:MAG: transcriptional regulator [Saprospiraceae bacterium]